MLEGSCIYKKPDLSRVGKWEAPVNTLFRGKILDGKNWASAAPKFTCPGTKLAVIAWKFYDSLSLKSKTKQSNKSESRALRVHYHRKAQYSKIQWFKTTIIDIFSLESQLCLADQGCAWLFASCPCKGFSSLGPAGQLRQAFLIGTSEYKAS